MTCSATHPNAPMFDIHHDAPAFAGIRRHEHNFLLNLAGGTVVCVR